MGKNMRIRGIDENCDRHVNKVVKRWNGFLESEVAFDGQSLVVLE